MVIAIDNIDNNHHRRHLVHLFMALPYRFFKKTRNRVEKEKANIDINLDEGEEEFKTLPEYYTTIHLTLTIHASFSLFLSFYSKLFPNSFNELDFYQF